MSMLVERIRAELVGRGAVPTPVPDASVGEALRMCHAGGVADVYIANRLARVLNRLERNVQSGDAALDARIALGEYDLFLGLGSDVTA